MRCGGLEPPKQIKMLKNPIILILKKLQLISTNMFTGIFEHLFAASYTSMRFNNQYIYI